MNMEQMYGEGKMDSVQQDTNRVPRENLSRTN